MRGNYGLWFIGVSGEVEETKLKNNNPKFWTHYQADSVEDATAIEQYFSNMGTIICKHSNTITGGYDVDAAYVYIY